MCRGPGPAAPPWSDVDTQCYLEQRRELQGDRPLCGDESPFAVYTDEPDQVAGCQDCQELVAEDLQDPDTRYGGYCLHCRREINATGSVEWRRVVRHPCPHCGRPGW